MNISKFMKTGIVALALAATTVFAGPLDKAWIKGVTDKNPLTYKAGEEATLTLTLEGVEGEIPADKYFLKWERTGDDGKKDKGRVALNTMPLVIKTKIENAGFFRVFAEVVEVVNGKDKKYQKQFTGDASTPEGKIAMNKFEKAPRNIFFDGGAGADIDTLQGVPEPKDFDEFWKRHKETLAKVPFKDNVELKEVKTNPNWTVYAVSIPCAGPRPVTGYISIPKKPGKYPAHLTSHGYGTRMHLPIGGSNGEIRLDINAFGFELGKDKAFYDDFFKKISIGDPKKSGLPWSKTCSYAFDIDSNSDPETAYFSGMTYRIMRALQYLKSRPEWDGKNLLASGGSQGGLQTIWAAGLDPDVTSARSNITWCCDMGGTELKRNRGGWYIHWTPALGYYDPINICKRIPKTCKVEIPRAGLGDYTCPPSGLAILYNNMTCPKKISWMQGSTHGYVPPAYPERDFVREAPAK